MLSKFPSIDVIWAKIKANLGIVNHYLLSKRPVESILESLIFTHFSVLSRYLIPLLLWGQIAFGFPCSGRFPNPVTDICWSCLFPIKIGGINISSPAQNDNFDPPPPLICTCPMALPPYIRVGVGVSYWEPARVAEVVRTPMCSPTLNGTILGKIPAPAGNHHEEDGRQGDAFYHVHWFQYPVLSWLGMVIAQGACMVSESFDIAYMTEIDPLWDDDELGFLTSPEAVLFANPISQAACVAD